jgi:hypothetical protein
MFVDIVFMVVIRVISGAACGTRVFSQRCYAPLTAGATMLTLSFPFTSIVALAVVHGVSFL